MFSVQQKYRGRLGEVRLSQAEAGARHRNKTSGIALKYVCQGTEHYQIGGQSTFVESGQFMVLPEDRKFEASTDRRPLRAKGICIDLDADFVLEEIPDFHEHQLLFELPFKGQHFLQLPQSFARFAQGSLQAASSGELMQQIRKELALLVQLIQAVQPRMSRQIKKTSTQKHLLAKLFQVKDFIHQHYRSSITLKILAREVGISPYHLTRLFQSCFVQSPQQLQLQLRMQAAMSMIKNDQLSLTQVAFTLGYCDQASFSKQFKQYYQESPSNARKNCC